MKIAAATAPGEAVDFIRAQPPNVEPGERILSAVATTPDRDKPSDETREGLKRFLRFVNKSASEKPKRQRGIEGYQFQASVTTGTKGLYLDKFC